MATAAEVTGRRVTAALQRRQSRCPVRRVAYARLPSSRISSGSSSTATATAIVTTIIAPAAMDRSAVFRTSRSPASEMTTATPEKITATPEVDIALTRAVSGSLPDATSSR